MYAEYEFPRSVVVGRSWSRSRNDSRRSVQFSYLERCRDVP
jgi:hypothetical protein